MSADQTIWKYELEITDRQTILMPAKARILSVQVQHERLCLWALVNPVLTKEERHFEVFGTGHPVPNRRRAYLGTVQISGGSLVFHVFETET